MPQNTNVNSSQNILNHGSFQNLKTFAWLHINSFHNNIENEIIFEWFHFWCGRKEDEANNRDCLSKTRWMQKGRAKMKDLEDWKANWTFSSVAPWNNPCLYICIYIWAAVWQMQSSFTYSKSSRFHRNFVANKLWK